MTDSKSTGNQNRQIACATAYRNTVRTYSGWTWRLGQHSLGRRAAKAIGDSAILMVENAMIYSQYFSLTLRDIDRGLAGDDRKDEATRKGMRTIARQLLGGKKRLTEKDRALCNEMLSMFVPELVEEYLDEYFTREMIRKIPKMVQRTMGLSNLAVEKTPPEQLNVYLGEATKCYVLGLPQASVALCRAALEQGIREILRKDGADSSGDLSELLETASGAKVLNSAILRFAEDVRRAANRVLHFGPLTDKDASEVLLKTRAVLGHLFGDIDLRAEVARLVARQSARK